MAETMKSQLDMFLGDIQEKDIKRLVAAVEIDRLSGGRGLPYNSVLDALRPALRKYGSLERVPTPQRMFCTAFEDILQTVPRTSKQRGRISRSSIMPIWEWMAIDLVPEQLDAMEQEVAQFILDEKLDEAWASVRNFQKVAGAAILQSVESSVHDAKEYDTLSEYLGGDIAIADLRDIAMCLIATDTINQVQSTFGRPIEGFSEQALAELERIYTASVARHEEQTVYVLLVIMARMTRPWEILSIIAPNLGAMKEAIYRQKDCEIICELLLDDVFNLSRYFTGLEPHKIDCAEFIETLNFFLQLGDAIVASLDTGEYPEQLARVEKARANVTDELKKIIERLPDAIMKSLPTKSSGGYRLRDKRVPATSSAPDEAAAIMAIELIRLFAECRFYAKLSGFSPSYNDAVKEFDYQFENYKSALITHVEKTEGEEQENALAFVELLAQIGEEYRGTVEADLIRHRAASAGDRKVKYGT